MRTLAATLTSAALPILHRLEPELAHRLALGGLDRLHRLWPVPAIPAELAVHCLGLRFAHPVGVAAGFDKDGDHLDALGALGFSHVEVGTVTPRPQDGNPRPRLFRLPAAMALVNRMGFKSKGADYVAERLRRSRYAGVRGISIGKNAATPLERAAEDYLECYRKLYEVADYVAVNVSSPNTFRLRELQTGEGLAQVVEPLLAERRRLAARHGKRSPLLVKLAPDLDDEALAAAAAELRRLGVDGVIATNTTVDLAGVPGVGPEHRGGGLSGQPLHARAVALIRRLRAALGPGFPIIGVGGITSGAAAAATLAAGADLVQVYTGLVYRGPALLDEILAVLGAQARAAVPRS